MIDTTTLPPLQGTERQINWAARIRAGWVDEINDEIETYGEKCETAYREVLGRQQLLRSSWWVERHHSAGPWLRLEAQKLGAFKKKEAAMICPYCQTRFSTEAAYQIHLGIGAPAFHPCNDAQEMRDKGMTEQNGVWNIDENLITRRNGWAELKVKP